MAMAISSPSLLKLAGKMPADAMQALADGAEQKKGGAGCDLSRLGGRIDQELSTQLVDFCASSAGNEGVHVRLAHNDLGSGTDLEQRLYDILAERKVRVAGKAFHEKKKAESSKEREFPVAAQKKREAQAGIDEAEKRLGETGAELVDLEPRKRETPWFALFSQIEVQQRNSIRFLDLSNCGLHASSLDLLTQAMLEHEHRADSVKVSRLSLDNNDLNDQGMAPLASLVRLSSAVEALQLRNVGVTERGMSEVCAGLVQNKTLALLDLRDNGLCPVETGRSIIAGIQRFNKTVRIVLD